MEEADLIDRYFSRQLDESELKEFAIRYNSVESFRNKVEECRLAIGAVRKYRDNQLRSRIRETAIRHYEFEKTKKILITVFSAAAIILLIAGIYFLGLEYKPAPGLAKKDITNRKEQAPAMPSPKPRAESKDSLQLTNREPGGQSNKRSHKEAKDKKTVRNSTSGEEDDLKNKGFSSIRTIRGMDKSRTREYDSLSLAALKQPSDPMIFAKISILFAEESDTEAFYKNFETAMQKGFPKDSIPKNTVLKSFEKERRFRKLLRKYSR